MRSTDKSGPVRANAAVAGAPWPPHGSGHARSASAAVPLPVPGDAPPHSGAARRGGSVGVAVVDGDREVRKAACGVLRRSDEFQCWGCFSTAAEALEAIPRLPIRIALVGLALPDLCGIRLIRELRCRHPALRLILIGAALAQPAIVRLAVAAGADWCCLSPLSGEQCLLALRLIAIRLHAAQVRIPLTAREADILACLDDGLPYKVIPDRLKISSSLVKKLQQRIFHKLEVHSRTHAVNKWHELGTTGTHGERGFERNTGAPQTYPPPVNPLETTTRKNS